VFVSTPEPKPEQPRQADGEREVRSRPEPTARDTPARPPQMPQDRHDSWRGSTYRRPARPAPPAADGGELVEDGVDDLYR
jgi:hypothetical protein